DNIDQLDLTNLPLDSKLLSGADKAAVEKFISDTSQELKKTEKEHARDFLEQAYSLIDALDPFGKKHESVLALIKELISSCKKGSFDYFASCNEAIQSIKDETTIVEKFYETKANSTNSPAEADKSFAEFKLQLYLENITAPLTPVAKDDSVFFESLPSTALKDSPEVPAATLNARGEEITRLVRRSVLPSLVYNYQDEQILAIFAQLIFELPNNLQLPSDELDNTPIKNINLPKLAESENDSNRHYIKFLQSLQHMLGSPKGNRPNLSTLTLKQLLSKLTGENPNTDEERKELILQAKTTYGIFIKWGGGLNKFDLIQLRAYFLNCSALDDKDKIDQAFDNLYTISESRYIYLKNKQFWKVDQKIAGNDSYIILALITLIANTHPAAKDEVTPEQIAAIRGVGDEYKATPGQIAALRAQMNLFLKSSGGLLAIGDGDSNNGKDNVLNSIKDYIWDQLSGLPESPVQQAEAQKDTQVLTQTESQKAEQKAKQANDPEIEQSAKQTEDPQTKQVTPAAMVPNIFTIAGRAARKSAGISSGFPDEILNKFFSNCDSKKEVKEKLKNKFQIDSQFIHDNYNDLIDMFTANYRDTPHSWANVFATAMLKSASGFFDEKVAIDEQHYYLRDKGPKFIPGDGNCFYHVLHYLMTLATFKPLPEEGVSIATDGSAEILEEKNAQQEAKPQPESGEAQQIEEASGQDKESVVDTPTNIGEETYSIEAQLNEADILPTTDEDNIKLGMKKYESNFFGLFKNFFSMGIDRISYLATIKLWWKSFMNY
ncbi:MAG: hypothetical protein ACK4M7_00815, partial [Burkholderiales bacterium]